MLTDNAAALAPVLDDVIAELSELRAELGDPVALRARLDQVALAAEGVRRGAPALEVCASLGAAIEEARSTATSLVVRRRDGAFEVATIG